MLLPQLPVRPLRVLLLVRQLRLVLFANLLLPQLVNGPLLTIFQLLREFVVTQQHGVGLFELSLPFIQFLKNENRRLRQKSRRRRVDS